MPNVMFAESITTASTDLLEYWLQGKVARPIYAVHFMKSIFYSIFPATCLVVTLAFLNSHQPLPQQSLSLSHAHAHTRIPKGGVTYTLPCLNKTHG